MTTATTHTCEPHRPTALFAGSFRAVFAHGFDMLRRITAARHYQDTQYLPRPIARDITTAEARIDRALEWMVALWKTLGGSRTWRRRPAIRSAIPNLRPLPNPPQVAALTAAFRAITARLNPPDPAIAENRRIRRAFATQPIGRIAARLCRRMGLKPGADDWPADLMHLTQTPAQWADQNPPEPAEEPPPHAPAQPRPTDEPFVRATPHPPPRRPAPS